MRSCRVHNPNVPTTALDLTPYQPVSESLRLYLCKRPGSLARDSLGKLVAGNVCVDDDIKPWDPTLRLASAPRKERTHLRSLRPDVRFKNHRIPPS